MVNKSKIFQILCASLTSVAVAQTGPTPEKGPVGLLFQSDLTTDIFAAPTLSSDVVIDISGEIARVNIRQRFRNPSEVWLEGVYVFPLPERAAVDRLSLRIGAREFEGEIFEKKEAERVYREAADAGRQASCGERSITKVRCSRSLRRNGGIA